MVKMVTDFYVELSINPNCKISPFFNIFYEFIIIYLPSDFSFDVA